MKLWMARELQRDNGIYQFFRGDKPKFTDDEGWVHDTQDSVWLFGIYDYDFEPHTDECMHLDFGESLEVLMEIIPAKGKAK